MIVEPIAIGVRILLKVVPGARRSELAGVLGDRLKVRVAAPPEDGKANLAVIELLAEALSVPARAITITAGHTRPEKTLEAVGVTAEAARRVLGVD